MRVAIDARQVYRPDRRGIGKSLVDLLRAAAAARPGWEFRLFHRSPDPADPFPDRPNVRARRIDLPGDRWDLWERVRLPLAAVGADVLHAPANTGPGWAPAPLVVTVLDLIPLDEAPATAETRAWARAVGRAVRAARAVVTVSEYSRGRIAETFGVPPDRIAVVPLAPASGMRPVVAPTERDRVRAKYGLRPGERFVLGFGAADPRKNTARLIAAFAAVPGDVRLLLLGVQPAAVPGLRAAAGRAGAGGRVVLHGYAPDADLPALLSAGELLAFPSRNEGFGLPVLDAFACGTPVVCGDRTSLPEVAGGAAVLVPPDDTAALAAALTRVLESPALREDLAARGAERVRAFTWAAAADRLTAVYEAAAGRG